MNKKNIERYFLAACLTGALINISGCAGAGAPVDELESGASTTNAEDAADNAPAAPVVGPGEYAVERGDTLYAISRKFSVTVPNLKYWNKLVNPDQIEVGQIIRVAPFNSDSAISYDTSAQAPAYAPAAVPTTVPASASAPAYDTPPAYTSPANDTFVAQPYSPPAYSHSIVKREPVGGADAYSDDAWNYGTPTAAYTPPPAVNTPESTPPPVIPPQSTPLQSTYIPPPAAYTPPPAESTPPPATDTPPPVASPPPARTTTASASSDGLNWIWPVNGRIIARFDEPNSDPAKPRNKGIDISGTPGTPIVAAAGGKIVYAGSGLKGLGKLVIIKHNDNYLTAYAHNRAILVKESDTVSKGQKIAELGNTDTTQPKLHFELRRQGQPVDPLKFLPSQ